MTIEIIAHPTCPTCGGKGRDANYSLRTECDTCNGFGTVPRVLATFADAAELRDAIGSSLNESIGLDSMDDDEWDSVAHDVLAALGVSDDKA